MNELTAKAGSKLEITIPPDFQSELRKLMKVGQEYAMEMDRLKKALGLDVLFFPPEQVLKRKLKHKRAIRNKRKRK